MKAFHTEDLALVKHVAIVSDYTVTALNPEEPIIEHKAHNMLISNSNQYPISFIENINDSRGKTSVY